MPAVRWWFPLTLLAAFALVGLLIRRFAPDARPRLRRTGIMMLAYLGTYGIRLVLELVDLDGRAQQIRWINELIGTFIGINLGILALFLLGARALRLTVASIVPDVALALAYIIAVINALHRAGVDTSGLLTASAIVSAVVGISLGPTLGNIIGGLALQLDSSVHEGDWVQLDGVGQGRVRSIRWRHTEVETRNGDTVIVPNATLLNQHIMLLGKRTEHHHQRRYWVYFEVDYRFEPAEVISVVTEALKASPIPNVSAEPPPNVICMDFARDARPSVAQYAVRYWLTDLWADDPTNSRVRERVFAALQRAGMGLAIPAQTLFVERHGSSHAARKREREIARRVKLLSALEFFKSLTEDELGKVAEQLVTAPFAAGEAITVQGRAASTLYVLARGEAELRVRAPDGPDGAKGGEAVVRTAKAPEMFGEVGLLMGEPRGFTVLAKTACSCLRLERNALRELLVARRVLADSFAISVVKRRKELNEALTRCGFEEHEHASRDSGNIRKQIETFFGLS